MTDGATSACANGLQGKQDSKASRCIQCKVIGRAQAVNLFHHQ